MNKPEILALDFGGSSVKAFHVAHSDGKFTVLAIRSREIPLAGGESPGDAALTGLLKDLVKGIDLKRCQVIASVNCPKTVIRIVSVPVMPREELKDTLRIEAKNYFPFPIEASSLDFEILGETTEEGVKKNKICVAVSPTATVQSCLAALKKAGIRPQAIVPAAFALERLSRVMEPKEHQTLCLVDIGENFSECLIFKGREAVFTRKIPLAGADFTKALTGVLVSAQGRIALSAPEAEELKRREGVPASDETRLINGKISSSQIVSLLIGPLELLVREISRCFDYYREGTGGGSIERLVLSGRGSLLKGLARFLTKELGLEAGRWVPRANLKNVENVLAEGDVLEAYAVCLGAVLSHDASLNLLPPELKEKTRRAFRRAFVEAAVASAVILGCLIYAGMKIQLSVLQKRIDAARFEMKGLQYDLQDASEQAAAARILAQEPYWDEVLRDLSHLTAEGIYLLEIGMEERKLTLKGKILSEVREGALSGYILKLENGLFKDVRLVKAREVEGQPVSEFELECWVD